MVEGEYGIGLKVMDSDYGITLTAAVYFPFHYLLLAAVG